MGLRPCWDGCELLGPGPDWVHDPGSCCRSLGKSGQNWRSPPPPSTERPGGQKPQAEAGRGGGVGPRGASALGRGESGGSSAACCSRILCFRIHPSPPSKLGESSGRRVPAPWSGWLGLRPRGQTHRDSDSLTSSCVTWGKCLNPSELPLPCAETQTAEQPSHPWCSRESPGESFKPPGHTGRWPGDSDPAGPGCGWPRGVSPTVCPWGVAGFLCPWCGWQMSGIHTA